MPTYWFLFQFPAMAHAWRDREASKNTLFYTRISIKYYDIVTGHAKTLRKSAIIIIDFEIRALTARTAIFLIVFLFCRSQGADTILERCCLPLEKCSLQLQRRFEHRHVYFCTPVHGLITR